MGDINVLADKIIALGERLATPAAEVAVEAARMAALSALASGAFCIILAVIAATAAARFWKSQPEISSYDLPTRKMVAGCVVGVASIIAVCGLWQIIDPWTWATLSHPELWLAKRALGL